MRSGNLLAANKFVSLEVAEHVHDKKIVKKRHVSHQHKWLLLVSLQQSASATTTLLATSLAWEQHSLDGMVKHFLNTFLRLSRALNICQGLDLLFKRMALLVCDRAVVLLAQLLQELWVITQVTLETDKNDRCTGAVMLHLREPFVLHVLIRCSAYQREADQKHIRAWITEWSQTIVILLTSCIPQPQTNCLILNHNVRAVVVEHCWNILLRERVVGVLNQQASLTDRTVAHHDTLDAHHNVTHFCE